jgi:hypothetical protein
MGQAMRNPIVLVTVRDGKPVGSMDYLSHDEALDAVGLRE